MWGRKLVVFFVVDTSASMEGAKIAALNNAVEETFSIIRDISKHNNDCKIEIAVLQFSSGVQWMYPNSISAEEFLWKTLIADGLADFGAACNELASKLTIKSGGFMQNSYGTYSPVFILLSDGQPTDSYEIPLKKLKENPWFRYGVKIAIAISDNADVNVLEEFTGSRDTVLPIQQIEALKYCFSFVEIDWYIVDDDEIKQKQVAEQINANIQSGIIIPATEGNSIDDD